MTKSDFSPQEMMVIAASRELRNNEIVIVGIGLPVLSALLAQRTHAPKLTMIYESGVISAKPTRPALTMGDPALATGASMIVDFFDGYALFLQRGMIDVGFVGGAQVDKYGNVNSTVIGDYSNPRVRLPGSGGACEIAEMAGRVIIIMPHEKRRFVERVDFITSPGFLGPGKDRKNEGLRGAGPSAVVSTLGIFRFDSNGVMYVDAIHPGASVEQIRANTGWNIQVRQNAEETKPPTTIELDMLRNEIDPRRVFLGKLD